MKRPELPALTALRFPAAFAIVVFHYLAENPSLPQWLFQNLSLGVSFFYVLSGFILCYNYPDLKSAGPFWIARFARIWPVHIVTLLIALAVLPWNALLGHASWPITLPLNALLLHAWGPWKGSMLSFNGVSWSLSVEAFFYFSFPWLLLLFRRWGGIPLLAATFLLSFVAITIGEFGLGWPAEYGIFFPPCRLFEFALGIYTCQFWQRRDSSAPISSVHEFLSLFIGLGFVLGVGPLIWLHTHIFPLANWFLTEVSAFFFAWIIWAFAHQAGPVSRFLSGGWAVQLGQVSFSLYMIHQIVLRVLQNNGYTALLSPVIFFLAYFLVSMVGAYVLFFLVEEPARHWIVNTYRRRYAPQCDRQPA